MASVLLRLTLVCSFLSTDGAIKVRYGETVMVQFKATKRQGKEPFMLHVPLHITKVIDVGGVSPWVSSVC